MNKLSLLIIGMCTAAPAMAHIGPEAAMAHFLEHLLIALVIAVPLGYFFLNLRKSLQARKD